MFISSATAAAITVCDEGTLRSAIAQGGPIVFECDGTIVFSSQMVITTDTLLDAGGREVVLSGGSSTRLFRVNPGVSFTLKHLGLRDGLDLGTNGAPNRAGGPGLGAAIFNDHGTLTTIGCRFLNNSAKGGRGGEGSFATGGAGQGGVAAGGAVFNLNGDVFLTDTVFTANLAASGMGGNSTGIGVPGGPGGPASGGAIASEGGHLMIRACRFDVNRCNSGGHGSGYFAGRDANMSGGALFATNAAVQLFNTTFEENNCVANIGGIGAGGAVFHAGYLLESTDCFFRNNQVWGGDPASARGIVVRGGDGLGAGIFLTNGAASIANSSFVGNTSFGGGGSQLQGPGGLSKGGGICNNGTLTIINSTFLENIAAKNIAYDPFYDPSGTTGGWGGGIWNNGPALLTHVTMVSNSAQRVYQGTTNRLRGGAIYSEITTRLRNSLLAHSGEGSNAVGMFQDENGNISSDATPSLNAPLSRNNLDPKVTPLGDHGGPTPSVGLDWASPAIDAADTAHCADTDQRGAPRPYDAGCDIGAVEMWPSNSVAGRITGYWQSPLTVSVAGRSAAVSASGTYAITELPSGTWTVTPSEANSVFVPGTRTLTLGPSAFAVNFHCYRSNALTAERLGNAVKILFAGEAGGTYHFQLSTNLPVWNPYFTRTIPSNVFEFVETNVAPSASRAFRVLGP